MPFINYKECLSRLQSQIKHNKPIIGVGAGTGISAKFAEKGGADIIIIYNSGRYRMAGRGSLAGLMPYGDANEIVVDMAREVLPVVKDTQYIFDHTEGIAGFFGASSIERLATEKAIETQSRAFKDLKI